MTRIDSHIHWNGDTQEWIQLLQMYDIKQINICVNHDGTEWRSEQRYTQELYRKRPDRFAWVTTFDLPDLHDAEYVDRVISELKDDIDSGAVACKIWKNFGMGVRTESGGWMMPDDPLLDPVYAFLAHEEVPLVAHIGEPLACWLPLDETSPHYSYYKSHPEWHLYGKADVPSHEEIIAARDRVLERNADLKIIGAHLGSLAHDVSEVADRLERYPNFAVDTSARRRDLEAQDDDTVKDFIERYKDRILWGTDLVGMDPLSDKSSFEQRKALDSAGKRFSEEFAYYEETLTLDEGVLEQLFHRNALRWFPRLPEDW